MADPRGNAPFFIDNEVIVLSAGGIWLADGIEITHEGTRRLFSRNLARDEKGWFIQVSRETKRIQVEDTAFFVQRVDGQPKSGLELLLSDERIVKLDAKSLRYRPGRLTCSIELADGTHEEAKFLHAPYFDLLRHLEEDATSYFLRIQGDKIELAKK